MTLNSKNGNIDATLIGSYEDFSITSKASKGKNNLPESKPNGSINLNVNSNNGNINIDFKSN